jgi:hypothetical protein
MTLAYVSDHVERMLDNRIEQFRNKSRFAAMLSLFGDQIQDLEDVFYQLLVDLALANAVGVQLDRIGSIVGLEREGRTDADYRVRIGAQILLNNASGTIEDLLQLAVALGATTVELSEVYPAKLEIVAGVPIVNGEEIGRIMGVAKPAGVGRWFTWYESATPFTLDTAGLGLDQGELGEVVTGSP